MMLSTEVLKKLNVAALKEVCRGYKLPSSGNKSALFLRVKSHQEKVSRAAEEKSRRREYGGAEMRLEDGSVDVEFESVWSKFVAWCAGNDYAVFELVGGASFEKVDVREMRASFKACAGSSSGGKMEQFLEMFFDNLGGEWEMFRVSDRMEEESFNDERFGREMRS
jgi:hypothetical protein